MLHYGSLRAALEAAYPDFPWEQHPQMAEVPSAKMGRFSWRTEEARARSMEALGKELGVTQVGYSTIVERSDD